MKRNLLLIRHAETDLAGTFCGHADPPINQRGRAQIDALIRSLEGKHVGCVYSSDLQRALTTAKAVADKFAAPLVADPQLREIAFGDWETRTWAQIEQSDPVYAQRWMGEFPNLPAPNGEQFSAFEDRALRAFDAIVSMPEEAVIVSHAGLLRTLLTRRFGFTHEQASHSTKPYCVLLQLSFLYEACATGKSNESILNKHPKLQSTTTVGADEPTSGGVEIDVPAQTNIQVENQDEHCNYTRR